MDFTSLCVGDVLVKLLSKSATLQIVPTPNVNFQMFQVFKSPPVNISADQRCVLKQIQNCLCLVIVKYIKLFEAMFNKPNVLIHQQNHKSATAIFLQSANACSSAFNVHQHHNYPLCKSNMFLHFKTLYFHPWRGSISNTDVIIKYNQAHVFAGLLDIILQSAVNQKTIF